MKHTPGGSTNPNVSSKPRIWSLADMAASKEEKESHESRHHHHHHQQHPLNLYQTSGPGKIISPLANRLPYPHYLKPDFKHGDLKPEHIYRNFNGPPGASHLPVGPPDYAFFESYQRALAAHNGLAATMHPLSSVITKAVTESSGGGGIGQPFAPLSLTTHNNNNNSNNNPSSGLVSQPGASPSASSTSSRPENTTPTLLHGHDRLQQSAADNRHAAANASP